MIKVPLCDLSKWNSYRLFQEISDQTILVCLSTGANHNA